MRDDAYLSDLEHREASRLGRQGRREEGKEEGREGGREGRE